MGHGLMALGLERGDVCSVAAEVVKEWLFADLGIICAGGVTNGVYPTDSPAQVEYLINDSGTRFYFAAIRLWSSPFVGARRSPQPLSAQTRKTA